MKILLSAILLLVCSVPCARAQSVVTAALSDLILGFRASNNENGSGTDKNLEINLGNVGQFYNLPSHTHMVVANVKADLEATYDLIWNTRDDLTWGVIGASGLSNTTISGTLILARTLWAGRAETVAGTQTTPWNRGSSSAQSAPRNTIVTLYSTAQGSFVPPTGTRSSTVNNPNAIVVNNSLAGSWSMQEGTSGAAFGFFTQSEFEAGTNFASLAGSFAVLDLYELQPASGSPLAVYRGSFGLDADGLLQFSNDPTFFGVSSIPEPSAAAALLGAVALGCVAVRRRLVPRARA